VHSKLLDLSQLPKLWGFQDGIWVLVPGPKSSTRLFWKPQPYALRKTPAAIPPSVRVCLWSAFGLYAMFAFVLISRNCVVSGFQFQHFHRGCYIWGFLSFLSKFCIKWYQIWLVTNLFQVWQLSTRLTRSSATANSTVHPSCLVSVTWWHLSGDNQHSTDQLLINHFT